MRVSCSSESRATSGSACSRASVAQRLARRRRSSRRRRPRRRARAGAGRTRSESSLITPSVPSEPTSSWRRPGPAALAGSGGSVDLAGRRGEAQAQHHLLDRAVAGRGLPGRARRGAAAERDVLEGLREVAERAARARPARARARARACPRLTVTVARLAVEREHARPGAACRARPPPRCAPRSGATPPTTLVPPPNGTTASESRAHSSSTAAHLLVRARVAATASGAPSGSPARRRTRSG